MDLVWFRNDLRIRDNSNLIDASGAGESILAVYFFDPRHYQIDEFGFKKTEKYRAQFLLETVSDLKENLNNLNISLLVYLGKPEDILPELIEKYDIKNIYLQKEWTSEEAAVLLNVQQNIPQGIKFIEKYDQFLWHPDDIPYNHFSQIPKVFTNFRKTCEKHTSVRPAKKIPKKLSQENRLDNTTHIPSLQSLGLEHFKRDSRSAFPFKGGENQALERIQSYFFKSKNLKNYKETRNGLVGSAYSSKLSAWLANGSISPRTIYWYVKKFEEEYIKNDSTYWLIFELMWRDFFKYISLKHGDSIFKINGISTATYEWKSNNSIRKEWIDGATKYSFVNANMIELAKTGWMSNRGRQNVASFWSKENQQDWRIGAAYFESMLIDYDVHSNYGNWMYASGVGNDPRDRIFNIEKQTERYDASGNYTRLWTQNNLFD
ncbi:DASH family cryptochrome [Leeuwenhoekiella aequorea]|uniref:Cryptochrome DASH n=1 Tax=Leeuwenhoekiella aequorea TaxID=283736 RepID=A0A4Q0PDC3_9FLAO|nr:DASH family cryptochrome [Leeuwenhoekiella aequorea]RXG24853.1 deoxyribodipyrimidine photo-lyase (single-stranded DNA-specific) [Leeuwenhoekiella aequorea]